MVLKLKSALLQTGAYLQISGRGGGIFCPQLPDDLSNILADPQYFPIIPLLFIKTSSLFSFTFRGGICTHKFEDGGGGLFPPNPPEYTSESRGENLDC